jgi:hypothetical protein
LGGAVRFKRDIGKISRKKRKYKTESIEEFNLLLNMNKWKFFQKVGLEGLGEGYDVLK